MGVFVGVTGKRSYGKATIPLFFYRGGGIRTPDLSVPNRALYQAEPRPVRLAIIHARRLSSKSARRIPPGSRRRISHVTEIFLYAPCLGMLASSSGLARRCVQLAALADNRAADGLRKRSPTGTRRAGRHMAMRRPAFVFVAPNAHASSTSTR